MIVNKTTHAAWCGAVALVVCSSACVGAAVDGETFRTSSGAITGDVAANGFEVTVKPNGTVDKLTVDGTMAFASGAFLQVNNPEYLANNNFVTFLEATGIAGTFADSNLTRPCGWRLGNGCGQVFRSNGFAIIFR